MSGRFLIVNADDFGLSPGVNRGILETHERGILTAASLMVRAPAAAEAAAAAHDHPRLSVGLHLDLGEWICRDGAWEPVYQRVDPGDAAAVGAELQAQLACFRSLLGREPTHLDSHQHVHLGEPVLSLALEAADRLGVPLRSRSPLIRYCGGFYGQSDGGTPHHAALSIGGLRGVLAELGPGHHELGCHPGYGDDLPTMYRKERAMEVAVLCDPAAVEVVAAAGFELGSFEDLTPRD